MYSMVFCRVVIICCLQKRRSTCPGMQIQDLMESESISPVSGVDPETFDAADYQNTDTGGGSGK